MAKKSVQHIKFSPKLEWLRDMTATAHDLVPLDRLFEVQGRRPNMKKDIISLATCHVKGDGFKIVINTHRNCKKKLRDGVFVQHKQKEHYFISILENYAHELAHLKIWEHTIDHAKLTNKIFDRFLSYWKRQSAEIKDYYSFDPDTAKG